MSDKLSFIFYEKANLPRYYEINKKIFQLALYGFPTIALACLAGMALTGTYFKAQTDAPKNKTTTATSRLANKNQKLLLEIQELQQLNQQLQTKLASTPATSQINDGWIEGKANEKKLPQISLAIESPKAFTKDKKVHFHFNLSNKLKNQTRLRGFVHVIMKKGNKLYFWPSPSLPPKKLTAPYNSGEAFSTRYFRPVASTFPIPPEEDEINQEHFFFIAVYNTLGELIHQESVSPTIAREDL